MGENVSERIDISRVIQNGHLSNFFNLERGCRQGDPILPYLFIICAEMLGLAIKSSNKISGVIINDIENRIGQFADDTSLYLDGSNKSLEASLNILNDFEQVSGLKINIQKTKQSGWEPRDFQKISYPLVENWTGSKTLPAWEYSLMY